MDILLLRLDAPLMSFGAPIVDRHGVIQPYPALSMMAGLLGNALGVDHSEPDRLQRLQERLRYAVRQDRRGQQLRDYQTVDLSKPYLDDARAWTTRHTLEQRKGGSASSGTHIRLRDYHADACYTVALTLDSAQETPTVADCASALKQPARPLFIGRKTCLPAAPLFLDQIVADSLLTALQDAPPAARSRRSTHRTWWPTTPDAPRPTADWLSEDTRYPVTDRRDWKNQIHVGERWLAEGNLTLAMNS